MSTGSTSNYNIPYPLSTDPVNVANDIQDLADRLDTFLLNPAFINNININGGSVITPALTANLFNTNATTLNIGGAATVVNIGNASGQVNFSGDVNVATGKSYEVNNVSVLTSTTLGSSVVNSSLTSVGTISTGTWSATTIAVNRGGTGLTSYTVGDLVFASATTTLARLAGVATGNALISGGVGVAPSWGKVGLTTHVSGTLPVANGGTGITSIASGVTTWMGTPSSANLAAAITDETGSGSLVFASSPALSGTPTSITAAVDTNTTQIATTAFVLGQAGTSNPTMNGSVAVGTSFRYSRQDHVHPIDTSRAPIANPTFTGNVLTQGSLIKLISATSGTPSLDAYITVERGTSPDVSLRWNEGLDQWEFTNDGATYTGIGSGGGEGTVGLESVLMFAGM